jgi:tungstate transport system ATP-binding protein
VLSGGEQQRLAVARAWAVRPEVLFLDEPTANLDPAATRMVEDMIAAIRHQGTAIVLATHDMGQARRLGEEVLFLHRGRLHERRDAAAFFADPQSAAGRAYLAGRLLV